jgi:hypothetical protein
MKRLALALCILFCYSTAWAVVARDTTTTAVFSNFTSGSWTHVNTGANLTIVCHLDIDDFDTFTATINTFTYNSVSLSTITNGSQSQVGELLAETRYAAAPASGSHSAAFTVAGGGANIFGTCTSFTGADQSAPVGTASSASDNGFSTLGSGLSSTVPTGGMSIDNGFEYSNSGETLTPGAGQTSIVNVDNTAAINQMNVGSTRAASGSFIWTGATNAYQFLITVPINPVAAAPSSAGARRMFRQ